MDIVAASISELWEQLLAGLPRVVLGLIVFVAVALAGRLAARAITAVFERGQFDQTHRLFFRRLIQWAFYLAGFTLALNVMGFSGVAAGFLTGGGVTAIVIGFAFREIGENFLAGLFLAFDRPFNLGDLIRSGDYEGVVKGISLRSAHIRTVDGRDVFVPSSQLFKNALINYTIDGLHRTDFTVGIDYGDDPERATALLLEAVRRHDKVLEQPAPATAIGNLQPDYVELRVLYWVNTFDTGINALALKSAIMADCRRTLLEGGFTLSADVTSNIAIVRHNTG